MSTVYYISENHIRYVDSDSNGFPKKNHINGVEFRDWMVLSEAIHPINTVFGEWPELNNNKWYRPSPYNTYGMFEHAGVVFVVSITGDDLSFGTTPINWARARAKTNDQLVLMASTERSQQLPNYAEAANAFGKVIWLVGEYLDVFKPNQLSFNNASSKLGKLYKRALRAPSVQSFFKSRGYDFTQIDHEDVDGFGSLFTFELNRAR